MQNMITISLTVPAIEKLMEGDPEFVLSIRKSVLAEIAKRAVTAKLDPALNALVAEEITKQIGTYEPRYGGTIKPQLLEKIKETAISVVNSKLDDTMNEVREQVSELVNAKVATIESVVERRITYEIGRQIDKAVKGKVEAILNASRSAALEAAK